MLSSVSRALRETSSVPTAIRVLASALMLTTFFGGAVDAQGQAGAVPNKAAPSKVAMYDHIMKAEKLAGNDLQTAFYHRCFIMPLYRSSIAKAVNTPAAVEPAKVFDNVYFVGQNAVSSWAIKTSQGIILIDTLNNPTEAKDYIEGGLKKLGMDPKDIKYIIITHEHTDHFGGSRYLQEKYGAHVMASAPAWKNMPTANRNKGFDPHHDMVITDGQTFTFGGTTIKFYLTPGHSDGTVSFIFKTTEHGRPHVVGFMGGMGSPHTTANRATIIKSFDRWVPLIKAAGVDTLIANHQGEDEAIGKIELIRDLHAGDHNPFVIGKDANVRYYEIQAECTRADQARHGESVTQ